MHSSANTKERGQPSCKICGSASYFVTEITSDIDEPAFLDVHSCPNCGLLFIVNPLSEQQMADLYARADRDKWFEDSAQFVDKKNRLILKKAGQVIHLCCDEPVLLDVGCGDGHLLDLLRNQHPGVRGIGFELPECEIAAKAKGHTIYTCPVRDIPEQCCVATLVDVVEHVPDPAAVFSEVASRVKPNGHIIVYTPRKCFGDTVFLALRHFPGLRKFSKQWFSTRLSIWHVQVFSDGAMAYALRQAGFEVTSLKSISSFSAGLDYFIKRMGCPRVLAGTVKLAADVLLCRLGLLRTKVVCLAKKR